MFSLSCSATTALFRFKGKASCHTDSLKADERRRSCTTVPAVVTKGALGYTLSAPNFYWLFFENTFALRVNDLNAFLKHTSDTKGNRVMIWSLPVWFHGDGNSALSATLDGLIPLNCHWNLQKLSHTWNFFGSRLASPPVDAEDHDHERWPPVGGHSAAGSAHH